eukprot:1297777-Rhodomonas_salina.3
MLFLTTARGSVRFSPNLYQDGKVCLSLLGTFEGPRWGPGSSLYQVCSLFQYRALAQYCSARTSSSILTYFSTAVA